MDFSSHGSRSKVLHDALRLQREYETLCYLLRNAHRHDVNMTGWVPMTN